MTLSALRILGGGLLIAAGALAGSEQLTARRRELDCLRGLIAALGRFAAELETLQSPLEALFSHLTDCLFFRIVSAQFGSEPLEQLWKRAAAAQPIPEQARLALASLGSVLGRCGAQRQSDEIALTRRSLTAAADTLEREIAERTRRYPVLGAALGAIIATLLF